MVPSSTEGDVAAANSVAQSKANSEARIEASIDSQGETGERPAWINPELLKSTQRLLATNCPSACSEEDAIQTLVAFEALLDATKLLSLEVVDEEVHGIGKSQQP